MGETSLVLLEHKLESIPQLTVQIENKIPNSSQETKIMSEEIQKVEENREKEEANIDPQIKVFEKMLNVGVPEQAVRLKMRNQGLDDRLLDPFIMTKKM